MLGHLYHLLGCGCNFRSCLRIEKPGLWADCPLVSAAGACCLSGGSGSPARHLFLTSGLCFCCGPPMSPHYPLPKLVVVLPPLGWFPRSSKPGHSALCTQYLPMAPLFSYSTHHGILLFLPICNPIVSLKARMASTFTWHS